MLVPMVRRSPPGAPTEARGVKLEDAKAAGAAAWAAQRPPEPPAEFKGAALRKAWLEGYRLERDRSREASS